MVAKITTTSGNSGKILTSKTPLDFQEKGLEISVYIYDPWAKTNPRFVDMAAKQGILLMDEEQVEAAKKFRLDIKSKFLKSNLKFFLVGVRKGVFEANREKMLNALKNRENVWVSSHVFFASEFKDKLLADKDFEGVEVFYNQSSTEDPDFIKNNNLVSVEDLTACFVILGRFYLKSQKESIKKLSKQAGTFQKFFETGVLVSRADMQEFLDKLSQTAVYKNNTKIPNNIFFKLEEAYQLLQDNEKIFKN